FNKATHLPDFLNSYDYARMYNEALANDGRPEAYSEADLEAYRTGSSPYYFPNINWYNEVLRETAPITNYNISSRGANDNVRYFGLLNFLNNSTLLLKGGDMSENSENSSYKRYNFRTNVDVDLTSSLSASLTLAGSVEDKANPVGDNTRSLFNSLARIAP